MKPLKTVIEDVAWYMAPIGFLILNLLLDLASSSHGCAPPTKEGLQRNLYHTAGSQAVALSTTGKTHMKAIPLPTHQPCLLPEIKSLEL